MPLWVLLSIEKNPLVKMNWHFAGIVFHSKKNMADYWILTLWNLWREKEFLNLSVFFLLLLSEQKYARIQNFSKYGAMLTPKWQIFNIQLKTKLDFFLLCHVWETFLKNLERLESLEIANNYCNYKNHMVLIPIIYRKKYQ